MRTARIKVKAEVGEAVYHCMTRTVNGERILDDTAREVLRKQLWQIADYCGVQILTYAILSNHFHVLVRVPQRQLPPDVELLRRYQKLYPCPTKYQCARLEVIQAQLVTNGPEATEWRRRQASLMGDISQFMKLVKQRFSVWFNRSHQRYGTLWSERFKSVLVEPQGTALETITTYIDLNCVRAGLVTDPKDYRFCGYAEAVAGNKAAQAGLLSILGGSWSEAQATYRHWLFGTATEARESGAAIDAAILEKVITEGGKLPLSTVLRCRIRYFTDGAVLGSTAFVEAHLQAYRTMTGRRKRTAVRLFPPVAEWNSPLATLRALRKHAFG
ncbi:MAG TPA: transposase [Opitutaceae bacterium]|nr:transposase [Opitutaceae bacterium]